MGGGARMFGWGLLIHGEAIRQDNERNSHSDPQISPYFPNSFGKILRLLLNISIFASLIFLFFSFFSYSMKRDSAAQHRHLEDASL